MLDAYIETITGSSHLMDLHDRELGVLDSILLKTGNLDKDERELMRQHPQLTHDMLWLHFKRAILRSNLSMQGSLNRSRQFSLLLASL